MSVWYQSYNLYCTGFAQTGKSLYAVRSGFFGVSGDFFAEFFSASTSTMNDEISNVDATAFAANGLKATFGTNGTKEFFRQEFLTKHGYVTRKIQPVDMFSFTEHCEVVCLLTKQFTERTSTIAIL